MEESLLGKRKNNSLNTIDTRTNINASQITESDLRTSSDIRNSEINKNESSNSTNNHKITIILRTIRKYRQ